MLSVKRLSEELGEVLKERNGTIAVAESCTGGLIAGALTDIPGSSAYFGYGIVSYSNEAKVSLLNVREDTLEKYGAVSRETAVEMAEGVRALAASDYGLSVTGIAGPGGATETKPVGLVYIGFSSSEGSCWRETRFKGTRQEIRAATVETALAMALKYITGEDISSRS